jgi:hypothetical protein
VFVGCYRGVCCDVVSFVGCVCCVACVRSCATYVACTKLPSKHVCNKSRVHFDNEVHLGKMKKSASCQDAPSLCRNP